MLPNKRSVKGGPSYVVWKKNAKQSPGTYDHENQRPILRCSICTGEKVAGFKDIRTGKFEEVMFIRDDAELREFMAMYGISEIAKEY